MTIAQAKQICRQYGATLSRKPEYNEYTVTLGTAK